MRLLPISDALTQASRVGGNGCICRIQLRMLTLYFPRSKLKHFCNYFRAAHAADLNRNPIPPFFSRLLSRRWIVETNASPFSRSFSFVKCAKILRLKQSTTSPHWNFFKQLNYAEDEKGVFEKQEAVPLADGQSNGLMGMLNEWAILQGAAQRLVEFCIESVN